jgi:hypothetical protein
MSKNDKQACPNCHIVLSTSARQRGLCSECGARVPRKDAGADPRLKSPAENRRVKPL